MNREVRNALAHRLGAAREWLASQPDVDEDALEVEVNSRRNQLAAMRSFDRRARLGEELVVRLVGEGTDEGLLDLELSSLLDSVRRAFDDGGKISMALAGLSRGSTVVHFRPVAPKVEGDVMDDTMVQVDTSPAEAVGRRFVKLVSAAEGENDLRPWLDMVDGLDRFTATLEKRDLSAQVSWLALSGDITTSWLTAVGRAYVTRQSVPRSRFERTYVHGRVTELRESGFVKLKTALYRNAPAHEVHIEPDQLADLRLTLGSSAHFEVEKQVAVDSLDRELSTRLTFLRSLAGQRTDERQIFDRGDLD
ncbi:hypothetical protein [Ruania rhizosphaerae]|uniref:hypothetical protein n=1 Tax=Ruania rhizosphaerae TaxID=1840413 RepID=UPI001357C78E|nr:hypothetical protein [Ruania rhizosphaerae]